MLNQVIMIGRLTADPELRQTPQGVNVCTFTIAVERSFSKQGEERKTDFFDVVAWKGQADFVSRFFQKGKMIAVQGRMETQQYEDKKGIKRKAYTIVADSLHFCESKKDDAQSQGAAPEQPQAAESFTAYSNDEDLPF